MSLWEELKRRNVFKVGAAYLAIAWLLIQLTATVREPLYLPVAFVTAIIVLLAVGFPVALILAWAFELTPEGLRPAKTIDPDQGVGRAKSQNLNYLIIAALSLSVVFLIVDNYLLNGAERPAVGAETAEVEPDAARSEEVATLPDTVAVLPFEVNSSQDQDAEFSRGTYTALIHELEQLDRLNVIDRRTMMRYVNTSKTYQEIAAETDVQSILELMVFFADNRVRINAELYRVVGSVPDLIWSENYDEAYTSGNYFDIQADIARNIATRLVGELSSDEEAQLAEVSTTNTEALAFYLRGLPYSDDGTPENAANCLEPLSRAVDLDPRFKEAWLQKGRCHTIRRVTYPGLAAQEQQLAIAALEQALDIDDSYGAALLNLTSAYALGGNYRDAGAVHRRILDLGIEQQGDNVGFLFAAGYLADALESAQTQFGLDPAIPGEIGTNLRMLLYEALGDTDAADETYRFGRGLYAPWYAGRHGRLVILMGRAMQGSLTHAELARWFRDAYADPPGRYANLTSIFDDDEATVEYLHNWFAGSVNPRFDMMDIATHAAYRGEPELALEAMKSAVSGIGVNVNFFWTPLFRRVRELDEFKSYVNELGIVDVWREIGAPDLCMLTDRVDIDCI